MLSFTGRRNLAGDLANTSASATLTLLDTLMNASEKRLVVARDWPWLWRQYTETTVASTSQYALPPYTEKPQSLYVTVGSRRYTPIEVTNREEWDALKQTSVSSDIPTHVFYYDNQYEIFPTPSTSSNTITINARRKFRDLNTADITNLTITTLANGSKALTTSSGLTVQMAGFWIRPTFSTTANTGDGFWYEISSVTNATTATLVREYGGESIAAASAASTIAQCSLIPESFQELPVWDSLRTYFKSVEPNTAKAQEYDMLFKEGYAQMVRQQTAQAGVVIDSGEPFDLRNPNLHISL